MIARTGPTTLHLRPLLYSGQWDTGSVDDESPRVFPVLASINVAAAFRDRILRFKSSMIFGDAGIVILEE